MDQRNARAHRRLHREKKGMERPRRGLGQILAHLDHQPENCARENLKALCQRCHNAYDAPMRARGIAERNRAAKALGDLFEGSAP